MCVRSAALLALAGAAAAQVGTPLSPTYDIKFPSTGNAQNPLSWLGANGPYTPGPNVYNIPYTVPDHCTVDQAFYISRHGSRYPDPGAYAGWVSMQQRFSAGGYKAEGALSFLPAWQNPVTNPALQMSNISPTGQKELFDMAYALRTRYPNLYTEGDELYVWANNYGRVLQTARLFLQGFLGVNASTHGHVVSVTSQGFADAIGNSLAPSDACPNFVDASGGDYYTNWTNLITPPIMERLQALIKGNLTLTASDVLQFPYLCGFESQIQGRLSPFCNIFTDQELQEYQYANDLRYYYGVGPGTDLPATMMLPYLSAVVDLLVAGPNQTGTTGSGTFSVPNLLVSFLNDGQLNEFLTASGVHDDQAALPSDRMDPNRLYIGNRFTTMKGQVALERLTCAASPCSTVYGRNDTRVRGSNETYVRIVLNDVVYPVPSCQNGPGHSCKLSDYQAYVQNKYNASGNWATNCAVTASGAPAVVSGATFYTDLSSDFLNVFSP